MIVHDCCFMKIATVSHFRLVYILILPLNRLECITGDYVPMRNFQMRWISNYLAAFNDISLNKVSAIKVDNLYRSEEQYLYLNKYLFAFQTSFSLLFVVFATTDCVVVYNG